MATLEEYVKTKAKARDKGLYSTLYSTYVDVKNGKIELVDPDPPGSVTEYLFRIDYSLWFWTIVSLTIVFLVLNMYPIDVLSGLRMVVGIIYTVFVPGYMFLQTLYPSKELSSLEELLISIGLSIALSSILGLILNYTPFGIRTESLALTLSILVLTLSLAALTRKSRAITSSL